jgi:hypothetical protein
MITDSAVFASVAVRAGALIDSMTMNRAEPYFAGNPTPVKNATCAVAEVIHRFSLAALDTSTGHGPVVSEKNDGFSVAYEKVISPDTSYGLKSMNLVIYQTVERYLRWTGLMYAGVGICEQTLT